MQTSPRGQIGEQQGGLEIDLERRVRGPGLGLDAAVSVQAQTVANAYLAVENNLEILPVINKVDLQTAHTDVVAEEIEHALILQVQHNALNGHRLLVIFQTGSVFLLDCL